MNVVAISGNLTRDAELGQTRSGTAVVGFTVAVNQRQRDPQTGEWASVAQFVDCCAFGNYATAIAPHLTRGARVAVSGRLRYRSWDQDGQRRSKLDVVASEVVTMAGQRQEGQPQGQQAQPTPAAPPPAQPEDAYDEDIPF